MNYRFFHIPVLDAEPAAADLNRFLTQRRVLSVDRHLVPDGQNSFAGVVDSAPGTRHPSSPAVLQANSKWPPVCW
jgi:hypothetical protein